MDNVQGGTDDCRDYEVSKEQVKDLLNVCNRVLDSIELIDGKVVNGYSYSQEGRVANLQDGKIVKDYSLAEKLLPTTSGFFFGSTSYDEWYVDDLNDTVEILENILNTFDFENDKLIYSSSW